MEVTFTKEQWEKMQTMREVVSTSLPCGNWDQVLEYVADKVIRSYQTHLGGWDERDRESQNDVRESQSLSV